MISLLPKFILKGNNPSFYDGEAVTLLELAGKLQGAMNEVISGYNEFVENATKIIEDFISGTNQDQKTFEIALRQEFQDFIDVINLKIKEQDKRINDAIEYMTTNVQITTENIINEKIADGSMYVGSAYNSDTGEFTIYTSITEEVDV